MAGLFLIRGIERYQRKQREGRPESFIESYDAAYAEGTRVLVGKRKKM